MRRLILATALAAFTAGPALLAPAVVTAQDDEEGQILVDEARRAIGKRDYARAGALLDKALAANPRRIDIYVLRATVHGVRKEHAQAVALLRRAQKLAPDNADVVATLGIQLVLSGQAAEGAPMLETLVARTASRYDAQVVLGHHYVETGRWTEAVTAFGAYFAHRPKEVAREDAIHRVDQANAHLRSGDAKAAAALYQQVLDANPGDELARMGIAWASAALDCRKAMPLFEAMTDLEARYAEVSLVRGRCALLLGRLDDALTSAERYREARPEDGGGWALLGDVRVAKKAFPAAEQAFAKALEIEPDSRLYAFKLARTERALAKHQQAAERLRKAGPPIDFEDDWTLELGEALHTMAAWNELKVHIAPWAGTHATSGTGQFLLGAAILGLGDVAGAVAPLELGVNQGEPRARGPLVLAFNTLASAEIAKNDLAAAEGLLTRADAIEDDATTWRNLGAVLLARGNPERATAVLEKAVKKDKGDAVAQHLYARALHAAKKWDEARGAYGRAIKAYGKDRRVNTARSDLANAELAAGKEEAAVEALEAALDDGGSAETRAQLTTALVAAARSAATDGMRSGRFAAALRVLKQIEKRVTDPADVVAVRCDLALAATGAAARDTALEHLSKLERAGAKCPFVAPADTLGVPILIAWNEGSALRKASKALARLEKIRKTAHGVAEPLVRVAAKDIALRAAAEAYDDGNLKQAAKFLTEASGYDKRSPELAHNLAVIDLAGGKVDSAIAKLERLTGDVPEAWINLGIAYERDGRPLEALEAWRKAKAAGVRFGPLDDWIAAKERFWGGAP